MFRRKPKAAYLKSLFEDLFSITTCAYGAHFQPVPSIDYIANNPKLSLGQGKMDVTLDFELFTVP